MVESISLDFNAIVKEGLTIQEYLQLFVLYVKKRKEKEYEYFIKNFGRINTLEIDILESKKYIKVGAIYKNGYELREPIYSLFEGVKDLYWTWMISFPIKTPSGRYLSTGTSGTVMDKKLRKKWDKIFGSDNIRKQKVIDTLEAEVAWRLRNGSMEYMHNAETWLNQGDWEKYEYLLITHKATTKKTNEDFI